jgi:predicted dehydrogenase
MPKKTVNIAMIGCGGIAGAHLRRYLDLIKAGEDRFRIVAAVDTALDRAKAFASTINGATGVEVKTFKTIDQLLNSGLAIDGADICGPHGLHHVMACDLLNGGVNIICEKPIGITVKATKKIIATAKRKGLVAANAEQCRRSIGQRTINWAFNRSKILGEPRFWHAAKYGWQDPADYPDWHWRVDRKLGGCGMAMDSGAHWVDTMRYWFGEIDSVYARVKQVETRPHKKGDKLANDSREDFWTSIFNFKSGVIGTWSWTISAPGKGFTQLQMSGSKGSIVTDDIFHPAASAPRGEAQLNSGITYSMAALQSQFLDAISQREQNRLFPHGLTDGMAIELWDFVDALYKGRDVEIDATEGLKSKAVSEAVYESGKSGQVVKVSDVVSGKVNAYQKDVDRYWKL